MTDLQKVVSLQSPQVIVSRRLLLLQQRQPGVEHLFSLQLFLYGGLARPYQPAAASTCFAKRLRPD